MKKLIFFALLIWGCFTLFKKCSCTSCSSQNYREAVENGDFEKAHEILDKHYSNDAMVYINYQEIVSFLEEDSTQIVDKVNYIMSDIPDQGSCKRGDCEYEYAKSISERKSSNEGVKEALKYIEFCKKYNELCDKILNLAISINNKEMAQTILKYYKPKIEAYAGVQESHIVFDGDGEYHYEKDRRSYISFSEDPEWAAEDLYKKAFKDKTKDQEENQ